MSDSQKLSGEIPAQVLQQAAEWFVRLRTEDPTSDECSSWVAWIEADPAHRAAFAQVQQSWDISGATTGVIWPKPEELALTNTEGVVTRTPSSKAPRSVWTALAAGVAVAAVALVTLEAGPVHRFARHWFGAERISTARGEQQSAMLADGSRIELGGLTGVDVKFTAQQRLIVAGEGETYYRVARDPARPFVVQSGPVSITALGTAFSVRREGSSVSVSVSEGLVEVKSNADGSTESVRTAVRAGPGERVRFERGALSGERSSAGVWRRGRLKFEDEPLRVVVASVNRYTAEPIEIADRALEELHFTGTIFDEDIDRWLESIEVVFPVKVRKDGARIRIESAGRPAGGR